jgi:hypothetical protein
MSKMHRKNISQKNHFKATEVVAASKVMLYQNKPGKKEEAITREEKALALASEAKKKGYQETVDKMKNGEKTWKE